LRHIAPDAGFNIVAMAFERLADIATQLGCDAGSSATAVDASSGHGLDAGTLGELQALDAAFAAQVDDQAKRLWGRPGLSLRERCFATLAVMLVGGTFGAPFRSHIVRCYAAKLTESELRAAIRILGEFSVPKAWEGLIALRRSAGEAATGKDAA
jgi:hypothetical protein